MEEDDCSKREKLKDNEEEEEESFCDQTKPVTWASLKELMFL